MLKSVQHKGRSGAGVGPVDTWVGDLYILGTGVLAEEIWALVQDMPINVCAFVENEDRGKVGQQICGLAVIWYEDVPDEAPCVCALSTSTRRRFIDQLESRVEFVTIIHPSVMILPGTQLGQGCIVSAGVIIASNTQIGDHVFINRGALIGHHTQIGNIVSIQPAACIGGMVVVGDSSYIGMGAVVIERITIAPAVTIAAGSIVISDVETRTLVAGNPARVKKEGYDPK